MPSIEEVKMMVQSHMEGTDEVNGMLQAAHDKLHEIQAQCGEALQGTSNANADELLGVLGQCMEKTMEVQNVVQGARTTGEAVVASL